MKLLIVNNGLKGGQSGHYFETAVSVAEAARDMGLAPVLAAHVDCPPGLTPDWLPFRPAFRVEHWHGTPLDPVPGPRPSFRASRAAQTSTGGMLAGLRQAYRSVRTRRVPLPSPDPLAVELDALGQGLELPWAVGFGEDLDAVLAETEIGPGDHVFFPTAHGRELAALLRLIDGLPDAVLPTFHLEFRHAMDMTLGTGPDRTEHPYVTRHRAFFAFARRFPARPTVRLYTDTPELSAAYAALSGLRFETLPIPFRAHLIPDRDRGPADPVCVGYFGDVRDEKGFYLIPAAVEALAPEVAAGRVRFLVQGSPNVHPLYPRCRDALAWLRNRAGVTVVGTDAPLSPADYYCYLGEADVVVLPYEADAYRARSSGVLTEAVAAGRPTVVPAKTWLAKEQPAGSGLAFADPANFPATLARLIADLPRFEDVARAERSKWRATHSPAKLVAALLPTRG